MSGAIGMGLGFALVGLAPAHVFWLAVGAMFLAGAMNSITNGPVFALLQSIIPQDMQGRVFMIVGSLSGLASPLGLAVAGPVADWLGTGSWFIVGGVTTLLMGTTSFFLPVIMTIEEQRQAVAAPVPESASP
jgi:DHA3 family macrolide efflux protein-like MFS transporter